MIANGHSRDIETVTQPSPTQLVLNLETGIATGETIVVTYTDPTSGDDAVAVEDSAGNESASVRTGQSGVPAVVNGSTVDEVVPELTVQFEERVYRVVEGNSVDVNVILSGEPTREVTISVNLRQRTTTSEDDYTTSPLNVTFSATETQKTITITATDDGDADPRKSIALDFAENEALPNGITGSGDSAVISIVDNDFDYVVAHASGATVSVNEGDATLNATIRVQTPDGVPLCQHD